MLNDGYFEGEFATIIRTGTLRARFENGRLVARTGRGVTMTGTYEFDAARNTFRYEVTAAVPPFFQAVTGMITGASGRLIRYSGEATPSNGQLRFTIDFAGRSVDVSLLRKGAPALGDDLLPLLSA